MTATSGERGLTLLLREEAEGVGEAGEAGERINEDEKINFFFVFFYEA